MFVHKMYEKTRQKYLHIVKTEHSQNMPNYIRKKNARKLMPAYFEWTQIHLSHAKPLKVYSLLFKDHKQVILSDLTWHKEVDLIQQLYDFSQHYIKLLLWFWLFVPSNATC